MATRQTKQKRFILDEFITNGRHMTAEELYARLKPHHPKLSLATVYRNLNQFADQGIIRRLELPNMPMHFDVNTMPHHHAICDLCGELIDIDASKLTQIDRVLRDNTHFDVESFDLVIHGVCDKCRAFKTEETAEQQSA